MQAILSWAAEQATIAAVAAFFCVVFGYLSGWFVHGRKTARLAQELEEAKLLNHRQQVTQSTLKEQLNAAGAAENRLSVELGHCKEELFALRQNLDTANQKQFSAEKRHESAQAEIRGRDALLTDLRRRLDIAESSLHEERKEVSRLTGLYTKLQTEQTEREASHLRELAHFESQKAALSEQFKLLSQEVLEQSTKSLRESSTLTLSSIINPFQQAIESFKKEVHEIHHRETMQQGELRKELASLKALNHQITTEAHELSTALRGQKKLQGNWGELVLENVLDSSGLQLGKDYEREVSITTEEGRLRPDALVYLPQGRHLIIDAKVSLNAYTRFVNAEDDAERAIALKEHVQAVGQRIKELADRDYYKLPGLKSPEMVFMFIPIESAFVEALKADETLFQQAIGNHVLVATPTTLLTSLNIVKQLWRYEDQNKHTAALANKAEAVFRKLNAFLGSFEKIKKGLDSAVGAYEQAEAQLVSGKGNLVKHVGEFKNLAPAIKAELPEYFTEKAALEIDFVAADLAQRSSVQPEISAPPVTSIDSRDS